MSSTSPQETESAVSLPPPPREQVWEFVRRWRRSLRRFTGLVYWLSVQGLVIFVALALLFLVNVLVNGWHASYSVMAQITPPWGDNDNKVAVQWLAWLLALAGYLAVPSVVGALVGYAVVESSDNRRDKPALDHQTDGSNLEIDGYIPRLDRLLYKGHGHAVPSKFVGRFVGVHSLVWGRAQEHWERVVMQYLNSDAVPRQAPAKVAMHQAVSAAASVLSTTADQGRCPMCQSKPRTANGSDEP